MSMLGAGVPDASDKADTGTGSLHLARLEAAGLEVPDLL